MTINPLARELIGQCYFHIAMRYVSKFATVRHRWESNYVA